MSQTTVCRATLASSLLLSVFAPSFAAGAELPKNWPAPPEELERRFIKDDFRIIEVKGAGSGVTGASRLLLQYDDGTKLKAKWKMVPEKTADGWNNSPRKELAAYEIQRWIVDPYDFIVPTTTLRCIPLEDYKVINKKTEASLPGSRCVLGVFAVWMEEVDAPDDFYDEELFEENPKYAHYLSDFNVLTYLVGHRDGRSGNLLLSEIESDPRVYAVDNGIAFEPFPWNFFVTNWHKMRVPWVRKETIERLRKVGKAELDALGVVAELELGQDGIYRQVPKSANMDPKEGVRIRGNRVQFGLTTEEIGNVKKRIDELLAEVGKGKIQVR